MTIIDRIISRLKEARRAATLQTASFGFKSELVSSNPHCEPPIVGMHVDDFIKSRVKLHHETWIIRPMDEAINMLIAQQELLERLAKLVGNEDLRREVGQIESLLAANQKRVDGDY